MPKSTDTKVQMAGLAGLIATVPTADSFVVIEAQRGGDRSPAEKNADGLAFLAAPLGQAGIEASKAHPGKYVRWIGPVPYGFVKGSMRGQIERALRATRSERGEQDSDTVSDLWNVRIVSLSGSPAQADDDPAALDVKYTPSKATGVVTEQAMTSEQIEAMSARAAAKVKATK